MSPTRHAAIAIGSNSIRLLCANRDSRLSAPFRLREETALFLSMTDEGHFSQSGMSALVAATCRLRDAALREGASHITLLATSAVRDAANAAVLRHMLAQALPSLPLHIISGQEEARLAFLGALLPPPAGPLGVMDIGGGSTELALGHAGQQPETSVSLQLGAARLLTWQAVNSLADCDKAAALARDVIAQGLAGIQPGQRPWALVGGTGTALLGLVKGIPFGEALPEDAPISLVQARHWLQHLAGMDGARRAALTGMPPGRIHILPTGLVILCQLMARLNIDGVTISQRNNLDGYLYAQYLEGRDG